MAINPTDRTGLVMSKRYEHMEITTSPERTKTWMEPKLKPKTEQKAAVVYYLSRNGQLDHPHFMEVPLSSSQGLYLKDVINTLNILRGQGMASMYSWSSKRCYRNGYVWQDLSGDDFIHPCNGSEYILKGSLLKEGSVSCRSFQTISSSTSKVSTVTKSSSQDSNSAMIRRRSNSWSAIDNLEEYKVYQAKTTGEFAEKCANASTQTCDNRKEKTEAKEEIEEEELGGIKGMSIEEIPIQSSSNARKGSGSSMKYERGRSHRPSAQRTKASLLLIRLIGCGSRRFGDLDQRKRRN